MSETEMDGAVRPRSGIPQPLGPKPGCPPARRAIPRPRRVQSPSPVRRPPGDRVTRTSPARSIGVVSKISSPSPSGNGPPCKRVAISPADRCGLSPERKSLTSESSSLGMGESAAASGATPKQDQDQGATEMTENDDQQEKTRVSSTVAASHYSIAIPKIHFSSFPIGDKITSISA